MGCIEWRKPWSASSVAARTDLTVLATGRNQMALNPKAQARLWQVLFALVALIGLYLFSVPGGTPFGFGMTGLGAVCWVAVTAIINYHRD